jgi:hypothetical protein
VLAFVPTAKKVTRQNSHFRNVLSLNQKEVGLYVCECIKVEVLEYSGFSFVYEKNSVNISYNRDVKSKRNFFMDAS